MLDSEDSYAFIRSSSNPDDRYDPDLDLSAKVDSSGQLVIKGRVGTRFDTQASYISHYDPDNYYPNQLEVVVREKASSMFPGLSFDELDEKAKELVWAEVKTSKITWDLSVAESSGPSGTSLHSKLPSSWARLQVYQLGDIVEYDGKLWESKMSENFNHFPTNPDSEYWVEIGSGYDESREDWNLQSVGTQVHYFFTSPDGRLFHDRANAETHTYDLLVGSDRNYASVNEIWSDIDKLVKEVAYPVSEFQANGSESKAQIYFDSVSQSYRLGVLDPSDSMVQGTFIMGGVKGSSDENIEAGDVVQYRGTYFVTLHASLNEDTSTADPAGLAESLNAVQGELSDNVSIGDKIYDQSAGAIYMFLGDKLPANGKELILNENEQQPLHKGSYIYDRASDSFYVATEDVSDANEVNLASSSSLAKVSSSTFAQGSEWNSSEKYFKGQIVLYKGTYYECQTNGILDPNGNVLGFDNQDDDQVPVGAGYYNPAVTPTDEFFLDVSDAKTQEYMDLQKARGQTIANNVWLPITNPIKHVLSFRTENPDDADVRIQTAGTSGVDADIAVMTDINGDVTGLRIDNPGRYYFPNASANGLSFSIPEEFQEAEVFLPNGESLKAKIIWGQNPNDPGPFVVRGFELLDAGRVDKPMSLATGENFSFATGKKTFLDHRDEEGKLLGITYTGADKNSEFFIGKDSKVSSYLNAENGGTSELANSILSLIDLREGLYEEDLSERSQMVQSAEQQLIGQEDEVVDKMVELSAIMARMETVKAHDEQYHLELDRRLAQELDIDMSDAIMRLTRASTAYQAAMQVGAQLLNTSLLNYL